MQYIELIKRISGVMVSVQASGEGNRGFKPWSGQTKHCIIGICFFPARHASPRSKMLTLDHNNVSKWSDMSTHRLLFRSVN